MTMESENILKALDNVRESVKRGTSGAELLGVHLEGPFINEKYKGAQNAEYILKPDYDFIKNYMDIIKIITYAPEKDENYEFTKCMCREHKHIALSIGHSAATYEQAMGAIKNGARHITHIFNAMPSMHHREPGIIGAAFRSDVTCELIADNIHVNPENYQILIGIKGKEKVVLITDSMRAGCLKSGEYELGGQKVNVDNTSARLASGTLAGSILTLNKGVQNVLNYADVNIVEAVNMASINAAKVIGIDNIKGSLEEGKDADIIILDSELKVKKTIVGGNIVYEN
jgi:N-acetylglucosamine-6-phosphate deacetylase